MAPDHPSSPPHPASPAAVGAPSASATNSSDAVSLEQHFSGVDPWEKVGFSRTLGGFFYQYVLFLVAALFSALLFGYLLGLVYPWPEAEGYRNIVGQLFGLLFTVFDVGTAYGIERYIAEWRIKDPRKMLHYIQFFINYQMITGLCQTTGLSIYALFFATGGAQAYAVWLMLILSTTQYPGMLGYFRSALKGLQRFDKEQVLRFIADNVFQQVTNIGFIILGRMYGAAHPEIGELMGLAIGAAIGSYIDDFFAMWLGAHYFKQATKDFGFKITDCFRHDFDRKLVKECLIFGFQVSIGGLVGTAVGWVINLYWIELVPQYSTWVQLAGVAGGVANVVQWGTGIEMVPAISESFLNGKTKLAQFYTAQSWKWNFFLAFPLTVMLGAYLPIILTVVLTFSGTESYLLAVDFLLPMLIMKFLGPISSFADMVITGASRPKFLAYIRIFEEMGKLLVMTLFIPVWHLTNGGFTAIVWILSAGTFLPTLLKTIVSWWYIHKKIFPIKFPYGQALIAPGFASGIIIVISLLYRGYVWPPLLEFLGVIPAALVTVVWMLVGTFSIYMFWYAFFGGFDDFGLKVFREAVKISGPSRPLMKFLQFFVDLGVKVSPWHNKFTIESEIPRHEALELMLIREAADKKALAQAEKSK